MSLNAKASEILNLARSRQASDRERLLAAIIELCDAGDGAQALMASEPIQGLLNSIFMTLVVEAERDIRKRLADKLADVAWAPLALINVLALDEIEIARPIIASSPVLGDQDLIKLLVMATLEHRIEVARRPRLGALVVAEILEHAEPAVLTALADNTSAEVSPADMARLVGHAETVEGLRDPLARHPRLTDELAQSLQIWVGQALRAALAERFRLDTSQLSEMIADAVGDAHGGIPPVPQAAPNEAAEIERRAAENHLIRKLVASGQLTPGYAVRTLRERQLSLFIAAATELGGFKPGAINRAINSAKPELLALVCVIIGIDKSVYPTLLSLVRDLNDGRPGGGKDGLKRGMSAFGPFTVESARAAFQKAVASV